MAMGTLGSERVGTAGLAIGMRSDLDAMVNLARSVNPAALDDPALRERIADAHTRIEYTKLLNYRALSKILRNEKNWPEVPLAKLQWSYLAQTLAELAVDLLGPAGAAGQGGAGHGRRRGLEPALRVPALHVDRGGHHRGAEEHHRRQGDQDAPPLTMAVDVRDLEAVATGIAEWLRACHHLDEAPTVTCRRPSEGMSSETVEVEATGRRQAVPWRRSLVVRLAPVGDGTFEHYDLALQATTQQVVAAAGIPTAVPVELEGDPVWLGSPFLVMARIDGHIPGDLTVLDDWIGATPPAAQGELYHHFLQTLAAIHRIDVCTPDLGGAVPRRDLDTELAHWGRYLDWYADGDVAVPALVDALAWCVRHRPPTEAPPSLLWGDVRFGNVIFDDDRHAVAVLDWEMATIGAAEHDLAWFLALEATQSELVGRTVAGFPTHDAAVALYEAQLGRSVRDLAWYEIFALVRSTAIMSRISVVQLRAGRPPVLPLTDNAVIDALRRRIDTAGEATR